MYTYTFIQSTSFLPFPLTHISSFFFCIKNSLFYAFFVESHRASCCIKWAVYWRLLNGVEQHEGNLLHYMHMNSLVRCYLSAMWLSMWFGLKCRDKWHIHFGFPLESSMDCWHLKYLYTLSNGCWIRIRKELVIIGIHLRSHSMNRKFKLVKENWKWLDGQYKSVYVMLHLGLLMIDTVLYHDQSIGDL